MNYIPLSRCCIVGKEKEYLFKALSTGNIQGGGEFTSKCEKLLEKELDVCRVLLTNSCTSALEISALILNIVPYDEVIVPSFTFVSTANAYMLFGAKPVFCDIRSDTLNLDENKLGKLITNRVKAIIPVHYAGIGCEMDEISNLSNIHNIPIVEDNAHGLFGKYKNQYLGTFGKLSAISFDGQKNITCGEGGAIIINDENYIEFAEVIRDKGTNRAAFLRNEIKKYSWIYRGSNYYPSELQSSYLLAQLEMKDEIQKKRSTIWNNYHNDLKEWADENQIILPHVPDYCDNSYHLYYLIMPSKKDRDDLIRHLKKYGVSATFHYIPLHITPVGKKFGGKKGDCPVSENISNRLVRVPLFYDLNPSDLMHIINIIKEFKPNI